MESAFYFHRLDQDGLRAILFFVTFKDICNLWCSGDKLVMSALRSQNMAPDATVIVPKHIKVGVPHEWSNLDLLLNRFSPILSLKLDLGLESGPPVSIPPESMPESLTRLKIFVHPVYLIEPFCWRPLKHLVDLTISTSGEFGERFAKSLSESTIRKLNFTGEFALKKSHLSVSYLPQTLQTLRLQKQTKVLPPIWSSSGPQILVQVQWPPFLKKLTLGAPWTFFVESFPASITELNFQCCLSEILFNRSFNLYAEALRRIQCPDLKTFGWGLPVNNAIAAALPKTLTTIQDLSGRLLLIEDDVYELGPQNWEKLFVEGVPAHLSPSLTRLSILRNKGSLLLPNLPNLTHLTYYKGSYEGPLEKPHFDSMPTSLKLLCTVKISNGPPESWFPWIPRSLHTLNVILSQDFFDFSENLPPSLTDLAIQTGNFSKQFFNGLHKLSHLNYFYASGSLRENEELDPKKIFPGPVDCQLVLNASADK